MQIVEKVTDGHDGSVESSNPSRIVAMYTRMHPQTVIVLSFGLDSFMALEKNHDNSSFLNQSPNTYFNFRK